MKRVVTVLVVAAMLLGAAIYYRLNVVDAPTAPSPAATTAVSPPPEAPPEPTPATSGEVAGTLTLSSAMSHGYLTAGESATAYATVDVSAIADADLDRPPLNVALVIDRSGSMTGDKIAQAKRAAHRLIDRTRPGDRVAVVSYGSRASVDMGSTAITSASKARLHRAIDAIGVGGGTNIGEGYNQGVAEVARQAGGDSLNRVILLSDGNATVGVTDTASLSQMAARFRTGGVSLSTMGVGLDYNEDLMAAMADHGAGNYYFIDNPTTVATVLADEFDSLAATVARNTAVVIELADGVELAELYGFAHSRSGDELRVSLAEFHAGENKNILLKLDVDGAELGERPMLDVSLSYEDLVNDGPAHQTLALRSVVTDDAARAAASVDTEVVSRVQQVEVAQSLKAAMGAYEKGNREQAQQVLREQKRKLHRARKRYKLSAPSFAKAEAELEATAADVDKYDSASGEGKRMVKSKKARGRMILLDSNTF